MMSGVVFLFHRIAERVKKTEIVQEDGSQRVAAVEYEMVTYPGGAWQRFEGASSHRLPAHDGTRTQGDDTVRELRNRPGAGVVRVHPAGGGGGGGTFTDGGRRVETWHSHHCASDAFLEQSKLKIEGFDSTLERRFLVSQVRRHLRIADRVRTAAGSEDPEITLPLD